MKILDEKKKKKKRITAKLRGKRNGNIYIFFHLDQALNFAV